MVVSQSEMPCSWSSTDSHLAIFWLFSSNSQWEEAHYWHYLRSLQKAEKYCRSPHTSSKNPLQLVPDLVANQSHSSCLPVTTSPHPHILVGSLRLCEWGIEVAEGVWRLCNWRGWLCNGSLWWLHSSMWLVQLKCSEAGWRKSHLELYWLGCSLIWQPSHLYVVG